MNETENPQQVIEDSVSRKLMQWRREHPRATLTEIEEAVEAELAQLRQELVAEMVQETAVDQSVPHCPQCGQGMVKNGRRQRKLKGKEGETIHLDRQQWRCLACGATLFPPG